MKSQNVGVEEEFSKMKEKVNLIENEVFKINKVF